MIEKEDVIVKLKSELVVMKQKLDQSEKNIQHKIKTEREKIQESLEA